MSCRAVSVWRRNVGVAAVLLLFGGLAACGGDDGATGDSGKAASSAVDAPSNTAQDSCLLLLEVTNEVASEYGQPTLERLALPGTGVWEQVASAPYFGGSELTRCLFRVQEAQYGTEQLDVWTFRNAKGEVTCIDDFGPEPLSQLQNLVPDRELRGPGHQYVLSLGGGDNSMHVCDNASIRASTGLTETFDAALLSKANKWFVGMNTYDPYNQDVVWETFTRWLNRAQFRPGETGF